MKQIGSLLATFVALSDTATAFESRIGQKLNENLHSIIAPIKHRLVKPEADAAEPAPSPVILSEQENRVGDGVGTSFYNSLEFQWYGAPSSYSVYVGPASIGTPAQSGQNFLYSTTSGFVGVSTCHYEDSDSTSYVYDHSENIQYLQNSMYSFTTYSSIGTDKVCLKSDGTFCVSDYTFAYYPGLCSGYGADGVIGFALSDDQLDVRPIVEMLYEANQIASQVVTFNFKWNQMQSNRDSIVTIGANTLSEASNGSTVKFTSQSDQYWSANFTEVVIGKNR